MSNPIRRQRPRRLIVVILIVGAIGVVRVALAWRTFQSAEQYQAIGVSFPVPLEVALSSAWGAAFLGVAWGLWRLRIWARRAVFFLLPAYALFSVAWLARFARSDYDAGRIPFLALASALGVAFALWLLRSRRVRAAFSTPAEGEPDDRHRPQD